MAISLAAIQRFYVFDHLLGQASVGLDRLGVSFCHLAVALIEEAGSLQSRLQ